MYLLTGVPFFNALFSELDCKVVWNASEGDFIQPVCEVATVTGKVRHAAVYYAMAMSFCSSVCPLVSSSVR